MFTSNKTEMGVYDVKAAGCDKLLASRLEGLLSSRIVEGVMNLLHIYHPAPRDDGVDIDICIPESVFRARKCGKIGPVDKNRGPQKFRAGYASTKYDVNDDKNNDDDNNEAMDNADPDSKDPRRMAWDLVCDNGGPRVWAPGYREQYNLKDAEWRFDTVPQIMDRMIISNYVDPYIKLKLR